MQDSPSIIDHSPSDMSNSQLITHNPQLLFLVGPTATGKSSLAFRFAEEWNAHILSADSRQIYQGLEITSGADIPDEFNIVRKPNWAFVQQMEYFQNVNGTKLFGISILQPTETWSIAQFREYAFSIVEICKRDKKNLIIVGGAGLYLESLNIDDARVNTPPDTQLRKELEQLSLSELQERLCFIFKNAEQTMNQSDWNNPRRLMRKIEILASRGRDVIHHVSSVPTLQQYTQQWIGLRLEKEEIEQRIRQRVIERIDQGAIQEIEKLLSSNEGVENRSSLPALSTTGVKEIIAFISELCDKDELIERWTKREFQYAKRQITWFKKRPQIQWFDANQHVTGDMLHVTAKN